MMTQKLCRSKSTLRSSILPERQVSTDNAEFAAGRERRNSVAAGDASCVPQGITVHPGEPRQLRVTLQVAL
jgi:hypothetical protein